MAHRSQHTLQTMETQTCFDLNAAIANWQQELARQPGLAPVVRRELETHLRDTVAELQGRGLNNEESFWLARRRAGRPQQLAEEFAKADPVRVWRERAFWIAAFLIAQNLWVAFWDPLWMYNWIHPDTRLQQILHAGILPYLPFWLRVMPVYTISQILLGLMRLAPIVFLVFFMAKGRMQFAKTVSSFILASRVRFVLVAFGLFFVANLFSFWKLPSIAWVLFGRLPWTGTLIALCAWLMQPKNQTVVKAV
jgi:hypothetical protein